MGSVWKSAVSAWVRLALLMVIGCSTPVSTDQAELERGGSEDAKKKRERESRIDPLFQQALDTMLEGRRAFRFNTFGDEAFWGGELRLHEAIEGAKLGGVGPGVSPRMALEVGLKVDVDALSPPLFTEPGWNMHTPAEIGIDDFQASRSPDGRYRTTPLKGLWTHLQRGLYHDGRFETIGMLLDHYDAHFSLGLTSAEKDDSSNTSAPSEARPPGQACRSQWPAEASSTGRVTHGARAKQAAITV